MNKVTLLFSAASLLFFAACTDYQAEFDGAFSGLEYADDPGELIPGSSDDWIPESSDNQVPGSSGVQNPESSSDQIPESSEVQNPESSGDNGPGISSGKTSSSATGTSSSQPGQSSSSVSSSSMSSSSQSSSSSVKSSSSSQSSSSSAKVYCSGEPYNPETQFCNSGTVYNNCNGESWNPETHYCSKDKQIKALSVCYLQNESTTLYNPDSQYCDVSLGSVNLSLCGDTLIRQDEYCYTTSKAPNTIQVAEKPKCGDRLYDPLKEFCYLESSNYVKKRTICHANPTKMDSLNIDLRVSSLDGKGHNGQICDTRDYQIYKTVFIDNETWMAQNMNYQTGNSWCYNDKSENCDKYGRLYDWNTAKSVCPEGWHLPTIGAIDSLIDHARQFHPDNDAEKGLKSTEGWNSPEENGDDYWYFSVIPGGGWDSKYEYRGEGTAAYFWSNMEEESQVWIWSIGYVAELKWKDNKDSRLSVRCQKNKD